jgi:hypothetical protein
VVPSPLLGDGAGDALVGIDAEGLVDHLVLAEVDPALGDRPEQGAEDAVRRPVLPAQDAATPRRRRVSRSAGSAWPARLAAWAKATAHSAALQRETSR